MKVVRIFGVLFLSMLLLLSLAATVSAAERIDKSNWQKVEKLLPEAGLNFLKKGDMVLNYGTVDYDIGTALPPWVLEAKKENIGKYKLTANNTIVETASGKVPKFIKGIPFPDIKMSDPTGPAKVMWNTLYMRDANGSLYDIMDVRFFGRKTGYERSIIAPWYSKPYVGYGPAENWANPDDLESVNQIVISTPFDMAGTAMMTWRYKIEKEDMLYGYVPAIRRVRRMTPAGRSDALFGSDMARDDGGYGSMDGNVNTFKWKFIGEGEVIGAFLGPKLAPTYKDKSGAIAFDLKNRKQLFKWSYENKGGSAAPWFVENAIWVKRPVWIIEGIPKDPYYNYGKTIHYIDKETNYGYWKVIYDRAGKHWKTLWIYWMNGIDDEKKVWNTIMIEVILDERSQHATSVDSTPQYFCGAKIDDNQFSLAGFTALCK